jgi:hypothetical protein
MSKVALSGNASGTGTFTIASPNSNTDRTLSLPDASGTVLTTATAGVPVNGPAFSAYATTPQTITTSTFTKSTFGTEAFDTNSNFTSSTFTPQVAGYYQINFTILGSSTGTVTRYIGQVHKNGVNAGRLADTTGSFSAGNPFVFSGSTMLYLNGSTDYVEIYAYVIGSGTIQIGSTDANTSYFSGALIRSAT